ncbi:MAG: GFA family protein [Bacillota bacterium]
MEKKTYTGGCHCGKFRYEVDTDLARIIECDCSHCFMKGLILNFVAAQDFRLTNGTENELTDYQFNRKTIHHLFCPVCGVESFARGTNKEGKPMYSINVRCLDDIDLSALTITPFSGKDI